MPAFKLETHGARSARLLASWTAGSGTLSNPAKLNKPGHFGDLVAHLVELTQGGADYSFE